MKTRVDDPFRSLYVYKLIIDVISNLFIMATRMAICLFEDHITTFDVSRLMTGQPLSKISLHNADPSVVVYVKPSNDLIPEWTNIVQGFAHLGSLNMSTATSGAILFVKTKNKILACCFGSSVGNINKENIIHDFGLAVAFNRIPNKRYKTMESYTLTENPIRNNRSAALPSTQNNFNIDDYIETITELSGKYFSMTKAVLIKGKEFFSIPAPLNLNEIKNLCQTIADEYEKVIKNSDYKRLTAVSKIKSKKLIDFLDDKLCEALNKRSKTVFLVDYQHSENIDSYGFSLKGNTLLDIEMEDLYKSLNKGQKFTVQYLKTKRIYVYDKDFQRVDEWSIYKCLFFNLALNIGGHILYKGNWYEVQKRYLQDLKDYVTAREIKSSDIGLLPWDGVQNEGGYNVAAAKAINGQCWDKMLYTHSDFSYGIEFCDILLPNYVMHIKKMSSSALNSHLLMQTYVSAQLLKSDKSIRKWIKERSSTFFKKNIFLKPSNEFKNGKVKYLIVLLAGSGKEAFVDRLPFFSLITFNMMIRRIQQLDFEVEICYV